MSRLEQHPTVIAARQSQPQSSRRPDATELRQICLQAGADDVGFVALSRPEMDPERKDILRLFPATRSLIALVCRMNPDAVRSEARTLANHEFHATGHEVDAAAREIVAQLRARGVRALNPPMAFPMEMEERYPGKAWAVSLKPLAVAAGLGRIGIHRNVIHPVFGNFILLGCVLLDYEPTEQSAPIDYNPCLECKLCVAACPVGAISPDGAFDFSSCMTHNYREFMGGWTDFVETVAESGSASGYRQRVTDGESASVWQSLAYGPNYKAAYCLAVCPAGEEVIQPFLQDRAGYLREHLHPLQKKTEHVYVRPNSDAEAHVRKRFPHKRVRHVGKVLRPDSLESFLRSMRLGFQPGKSAGLNAVYHFQFLGTESAECTITIRDKSLQVVEGAPAHADLRVRVDGSQWVRFLREDIGLLRLFVQGGLRLKGDPRLLRRFGECFV